MPALPPDFGCPAGRSTVKLPHFPRARKLASPPLHPQSSVILLTSAISRLRRRAAPYVPL